MADDSQRFVELNFQVLQCSVAGDSDVEVQGSVLSAEDCSLYAEGCLVTWD